MYVNYKRKKILNLRIYLREGEKSVHKMLKEKENKLHRKKMQVRKKI